VAAHRRQPVQDRSLRTLARILDATSSLLTHVALQEITTNHIAAAAGVSIGALYRFFPDKQTIIDAVAVRHVGQLRERIEATVLQRLLGEMKDLASFDPDAILNNMIDAYVGYLDAHPDFRAISFGRHISAPTKRREASPRTGLPLLLKNFMLERLGIPNTPELDRQLSVVSEAGERLIAYAFEQPTRAERDLILDETKKMLAGYLFSAGQD
jgi:AcrR family transcriptional regulator